MNCPCCNNEMDFGYIQSIRGIIWSKKKHKLFFNPDTKNGDVWVESENLFGVYKEAFRCSRCEVIVIPK